MEENCGSPSWRKTCTEPQSTQGLGSIVPSQGPHTLVAFVSGQNHFCLETHLILSILGGEPSIIPVQPLTGLHPGFLVWERGPLPSPPLRGWDHTAQPDRLVVHLGKPVPLEVSKYYRNPLEYFQCKNSGGMIEERCIELTKYWSVWLQSHTEWGDWPHSWNKQVKLPDSQLTHILSGTHRPCQSGCEDTLKW